MMYIEGSLRRNVASMNKRGNVAETIGNKERDS